MPKVPLLKELVVKGNRTLSSIAIRLTTVQKLEIGRVYEEEGALNESLSFQPWEFLESLSLCGYGNIKPEGENEGEASVTLTKCRGLNIRDCNFLSTNVVPNSLLWFWKCFTFLEYLTICGCENLIYWPEEELTSLMCLKYIKIALCKKFLGFKRESASAERSNTEVLLPKLHFMYIMTCPNVVEIPKCSLSIKDLFISSCANLQCLPEWLGSMVTLEKLRILQCKNLAHLPEGMEGLKALEILEIKECPKIKDLPEGLLQQLKNLDYLCIEGSPTLERHFERWGKYRRLTSTIRVAKIGAD